MNMRQRLKLGQVKVRVMIGSQESKENEGGVDGPTGYVVRSAGGKNRRLKRFTLWKVDGEM